MNLLKKTTSVLRQVAFQPLRLEATIALRRFRRQLRRTPETQENVLFSILRRGAESDLGKAHGFSTLGSVADFQAAVPVRTYDDFAPHIERVKQGEVGALFSPGQNIRMFAMTSGTTGPAKYIPVTDEFLREYRRGWHVWGMKMVRDHSNVHDASVLQLVSRTDSETTACGVPCGAISGLIARMQRPIVRNVYVVPPEASEAGNAATKYYLAARTGLARRSVILATANPSTLIGLARSMNARKEELLRDISDGTLTANLRLPAPARSHIERGLKPRPRRAAELEDAVARSGTLYPRDAWRIPLIGTWKGGTLKFYLEQLPEYFGDAPIRDIGLIASEGRVSIPMSDDGAAGVLDVQGCFFEFVPDGGDGSAPPALAHQVEVGRIYTILMTTHSGLYRYDIGDRVRVVSFDALAPVLEFLDRGSAVSSLTGEKVTEHQVVSAVNESVKMLRLPITNYTLCASWDEQAPYYSLLLEEGECGAKKSGRRLAEEVDGRLAEANIEYEEKRASGRVGPVRIKIVPPGALTAFDEGLIEARSNRLEQYKHRFLENSVEFEKQFEIRRTISSDGGATRTLGKPQGQVEQL